MAIVERPHVLWAERKDRLFITVEAANSENVKVIFDSTSVSVSGTGKLLGRDREPFAITIDLKESIIPDKSSYKICGLNIEVCAVKEKSGPFWGRLTKKPSSTTKTWLSANWNLWVDEDEESKHDDSGFGKGLFMESNLSGENGLVDNSLEKDSDDEDENDKPRANIDDLYN